ncbi:uncharacterized protein LOC131155823 isoform X2 [Malania oleifera]|uniref:uncharacterized protein LOC131155823 isoform X2 n=1 Tax=Malania oleifera TaxID=397392 RepID=UPI0025AE7CB8|nr:uncharacterized protein LOC131155823 isoform X2 [Malania oleifera]
MEGNMMDEGENNRDLEVAPALIAVHPLHKFIAISVGSDLRVFDIQEDCSISLADDSGGPLHKDSIRAICFGAKGKIFVSGGDDKLVKIWTTDSWHCKSTLCSEKRVSAVAIRNDELFVCFADKFGVVWVVDLDEFNENHAVVHKKATPILSHYCSIITSLEFSPDGRFIISADRDFKIRVTVFPKEPFDGAHEIQSFCLGHTEFVSCLDFGCSLDYPEGFLVSGGGDSTVRLWDIGCGSLLDTCDVGTEVAHLFGKKSCSKSNGREEECYPAVTDLCVTHDATIVAVAVQSLQGIMLLSCNLADKILSVIKVVSITKGTFIPTSIGTSRSADFLWMVTGVSNLQGFDSPSLARVRVVSGFKQSDHELEPTFLEDDEIPGKGKLLQVLQGSVSIEDKVFLAAAEALKMAMSNLLIKKQYSVERRDFRKRRRNDRKMKQ